MANFKKLFSLILVGVLGASVAACGIPSDGEEASRGDEKQQLEILKSDLKLTQDQQLSRIKADKLIKNQGYLDEDKVVAILSLEDNAVIDGYLADAKLSERISLGEYVNSEAGKRTSEELREQQIQVVRDITAAGLISDVTHTYHTVINAVAVETEYGNLSALEKISGVKRVSLADTYNRPLESKDTDASAIVNNVEVYETGIFDSSSVSGLGITGKGTAVAVLDSGFDLSHRVFDFEPERDENGEYMYEQDDIERYITGVGEGGAPLLNAKETTPELRVSDVWYSNKIPFSYDYADKDPDVFPYDSEHGTHVAGIIGGYSEEGYTDKDGNLVTDESGNPIPFKGVAKDTQLVLMKVFPNLSEGAETDDILAAVEDAVILQVDCINMSLGSSCGFVREADGDVINEVYDKLNESGVSLITAASNSYSSGFGGAQGNTSFVTNPDNGTVGSPASYAAALSVASISGIKSKYIIGNGEQVFFFDESNNVAGEPNDFFTELYQAKGWSLTDNQEHVIEYVTVPGNGYRANYTGLDVEGKVALVRRGDTTFEDKALQAKTAGAAACIIYNNIEGDILMSMGKSDHIPTISISREDGTQLAQQRTGTLTVSFKNEAGPFMSDFSSWGPLPDLTLKPDITAHGGDITSSVPGGTFDQISGTSMACPNLCGVAVLIRQFLKQQDRYESKTWKEISVLANQMMMSTATIVLNEEGNPYSPRKQGAGLASLSNVVHTGAYLSVDGKDRSKLELMDDPARKGVYEMEFNIVNVSNKEMSYDLSLVGMTESVSTSDATHIAEKDRILGGDTVCELVSGKGSVSGTSVSVAAGETVKLKVTYTLSSEDKNQIENEYPYGIYVEGYIKLAAKGTTEEDVDLSIPFLAFYGDWSQAPIFDKTFYEVESEAHNAGIDEEDKVKADYYATTPYGSYYYNYIIPLGSYLYDVDTSMYDEIPASEEHIAISDTLGMIDGISVVYAGLLRNCKTMTYTITDKLTGEVVYENVIANARKAYSNGGSPVPNFEELRISSHQLGLVNNRQYTFNMTGRLDYENDGLTSNVRNQFEFDFWLDNEAPVIKSAVYEKKYDKTLRKDRYYLDLTVYDNRNVMSVAPVMFTGQNSISYLTENPIPVYGDPNSDTTVRIEITDFLEDVGYDYLIQHAITFVVDDYALNQALYVCQLPGTRGPFRFTVDGNYDSAAKTAGVSLAVGEIVDLTRYLATADGTVDANKDYLKHLVWTSASTKIATVQEGQVLGVGVGRTTITVNEQMNLSPYTASITVNVRNTASGEKTAEIESVRYGTDREAAPLSENDVDDVSKAPLESLRFSYFDTIFAHARAGQISQIGDTGDRIFVSSLPGGGSSLSMYPGEQIRLHYDLDPWYVEARYPVTFESSNPDVASITPEGVLSAWKKGSATITLRAEGSNIMARLRLTVNSEFVIDEARTLVAYKGIGGDVEIPDDEGILYIGSFAFSLYETNYNYGDYLPEDDFDANKVPQINRTVTSVTVPEGVIEVQRYAFYNCLGLETVTLPDSLDFIRDHAFTGDANLKNINLSKVQMVGANSFQGCTSLNNIDLTGTYAIGDYAFDGCTALSSVDLSALRNAGRSCFRGTSSLSDVTFDAQGRTKLAYGMFVGSGLTSVELNVKVSVPDFAFAQCPNLRSVTLKGDFVSVGEGAFCQNPVLETLVFTGKVEELGAQMCYDCPVLSSITLPDSAFTLGEAAFYDCAGLSSVNFGANTRISDAVASMFKNTQVASFTVAQGSIYTTDGTGKYLLADEGKTIVLVAPAAVTGEVTVEADVTKILNGAFSGTDLTAVTFLNKDIAIGDFAFANCEQLERVVFPAEAGKASVGNRAFINCKNLSALENLENILSVGEYAFAVTTTSYESNALTSVTIGDGANFGDAAFFRTGLSEVTVLGDATFGAGVFQSCSNLETVNMPENRSVEFGLGCFSFDTKLTQIDLSSLKEIAEQLFYGCTALRTATMTNATEIGPYAFADCRSLSSVSLPKVEKIGEGAFSRNTQSGAAPAFSSIDLPDTLTSLGDGAFLGCSNLSSVSFKGNITEIPQFAFAYCFALETVELSDTVETIAPYAFMACAGLTDINLGKVKHIGEAAFISQYMYGLLTNSSSSGSITIHALTDIDLSSAEDIGFAAFAGGMVTGDITSPNLVMIDSYAFYKVNGSNYNGTVYPTILSLNAPKLEVIGFSAFEGNVSLKTVTLYPSVKEVDPMAFYGCTALEKFMTPEGGDGELNDYAKITEGMLYTKLPGGGYALNSVPAAYAGEILSVAEGTVRVEDYAGNANKNVKSVVLPDSLESIGDHAFFGYDALTTVEFRSAIAPMLESTWLNSMLLSENDPGYDILHNQYNMYQQGLGYYNFVDLVGRKTFLTMVLPANEKLTGYDSLIYYAYFGAVEDAQRSDKVGMEEPMRNLIKYYEKLCAIETITMADETLISNAVIALNANKQDPAQFGYTAEQWQKMSDTILEARNSIARLKIANAKKAVRDVQALIDALPDTYERGKGHDELLQAVADAIGALDSEDRSLLLQDRYESLLAQREAAPDAAGLPAWAWALIGVGIAVVVGGVALTVVLVLKKKRKPSDPVDGEDGDNRDDSESLDGNDGDEN